MENNIIQPLAHLLANAEFDIRKEAAWAISNATSGGTPEQIKYLVSAGCIKPLCDLLICADARIITVALEGLENILKVPPPPWLAARWQVLGRSQQCGLAAFCPRPPCLYVLAAHRTFRSCRSCTDIL